MINIIDNFLPHFEYLKIEECINDMHFPWFFSSTIVPEDGVNQDYKYQFCHMLFIMNKVVSTYWELFEPVLETLQAGAVHRAKLNLLPQTPTNIRGGFHTDTTMNCFTSVMYFDDSNGYTEFKDTGEKVYSKRNRIVTFPSNLEHTGVSQTDAQKRIVLNLNWFKDSA